LYFYRRVKRYDCVLLNSPNFEGIGLALAARLQGVPVMTLFNCTVDITGSISGWFLKTGLNLSVYAQLLLSSRIVTYTKDYFESFASLRPSWRGGFRLLHSHMSRRSTDILQNKKKGHRCRFDEGSHGRKARIPYRAMKKLRKTVPGAMLVLAGPGGNDVVGEKSYGDYVKDLLESAHVPYRMLGKLSDRELAALYEKLDVLVLPSVNHTEAFGIVQAEAMMAGTPVVASNIPGVRIPVSVTGMGLTVNPKDANGLSALRYPVEPARYTWLPEKAMHSRCLTYTKRMRVMIEFSSDERPNLKRFIRTYMDHAPLFMSFIARSKRTVREHMRYVKKRFLISVRGRILCGTVFRERRGRYRTGPRRKRRTEQAKKDGYTASSSGTTAGPFPFPPIPSLPS
jgi:hypothetical protein